MAFATYSRSVSKKSLLNNFHRPPLSTLSAPTINAMQTKQTEILVSFDLDNNPVIEVIGGDGKTCTDLTKALETALGTVSTRDFKPEHRQATAQATNQLRQR
jgi:Protein of unknown function (DUF2997)